MLSRLIEAVVRGDAAEVASLLASGEAPNERIAGTTPLAVAARDGRADLVKALLGAGADPNLTGTAPPFGGSPLMLAAALGHADAVGLLLAFGADADAADADGFTPLHLAASRAKSGVVKALLDAGAGVNARTMDGETPLMQACRAVFRETGPEWGGDLETVRLLLEAGADVGARNNYGETALALAERSGLDDVARELRRVRDLETRPRDR
jgi:ankyrin repeat protein